MRRIVAIELLTLDGVMQAPGAPDEDPRGGFELGSGQRLFPDDTPTAALRLISSVTTAAGVMIAVYEPAR